MPQRTRLVLRALSPHGSSLCSKSASWRATSVRVRFACPVCRQAAISFWRRAPSPRLPAPRAALRPQFLVAQEPRGLVLDGGIISDLDPSSSSENENIAGWGGLTEYSSRFGEVVRRAVNESGQ